MDKLLEKGIIPKFKHGDIVAFTFVDLPCVYCYLLEKHSMGPNLDSMIKRLAKETREELRMTNIVNVGLRK